ncbi:DEAD-box ATP-dependent RNA helicase 41 [Beta vulgaris subsp. vulgaris]|uniref:DEAD-box ATP-dependent RNA helicase 41 n=1 Tax=Beta vulgaris subsp. vulgaris TaxID=3555 RepID=UPI002036B494|nr:DEAD-box ATP-dependent RNA helicase 41 [Beta vulgaris subsp. vulgaris]XP_010685098.2 DEAD-box ATP-dependent RNA helicase 41 [Beta vulgaris subsp. vulgaris]
MEVGSIDHELDYSCSTGTDEDNADEVKVRCWDQREAEPGEPCCAICGRYGEYICDETDDDICSLQCKKILLERIAKSKFPSSLPVQKRLPTSDECFYVRDTERGSSSRLLSDEETALLRERLHISVRCGSVLPPVLSFSSCDLPVKLLQNIESMEFELPTPVQMQAIPAALNGNSLLVSAETGSGKTASYLIPIITRCANFSRGQLNKRKPLAMVLTPTRELCVQVEEEAKLLGKGLPFKTALVIGGDAMAGQVYRIQQGVELIVGTPGRLIDLLTKHDIELDSISMFVVDEVDCMLQRGFRDQVMQLFRALSCPQVLMFSATLSAEVEKMSHSMAKALAVVFVGKPNKANLAVKQIAIWVESKHKKQKLFDILMSKQHYRPPVVVFVASRLGADLLAEAINITTRVKALSIHGEKSMSERREIIRCFLMGEVSVLVATGLLGRGVDLVSVRQVIVFDMPNSMKEYIHLIGRASRRGEEGNAIVFINEENKKVFPELVDVLKSSRAAVPKELANSRFTTYLVSMSKSRKKRKHGA